MDDHQDEIAVDVYVGMFIPSLCASLYGECAGLLYNINVGFCISHYGYGFPKTSKYDEREYRFPRFLFLCSNILFILICLWGNRGR